MKIHARRKTYRTQKNRLRDAREIHFYNQKNPTCIRKLGFPSSTRLIYGNFAWCPKLARQRAVVRRTWPLKLPPPLIFTERRPPEIGLKTAGTVIEILKLPVVFRKLNSRLLITVCVVNKVHRRQQPF